MGCLSEDVYLKYKMYGIMKYQKRRLLLPVLHMVAAYTYRFLQPAT